ncbi:MAG: PorT family protein [Bacteroidales bacterium]|nr:PorT family protein [Bacteroidales bacterium]
MKKIIPIFCLSILSLSSVNAQRTGLEFSFSVLDLIYACLDDEQWPNNFVGFNIGAIEEFPLSENISVEPALLLYQKRGVYSKKILEDFYSISYINLPLHFVGKIPFNDWFAYIKAGPFISYGIGAKEHIGKDSYRIKLKDKECELKDIDAGLSFGIGMGVDQIYFGVLYQKGLLDISNISSRTTKTRVLSISLDYLF